METVNTTERLRELRRLMKENSVDIYGTVVGLFLNVESFLMPFKLCHLKTATNQKFISGFSGSAGTAVITSEKAALATDGRYFNQASKQLDSNWHLLKQGLEDVPTWQDWTAEQSEGHKTVGVDPTVIAAPEARKLTEKIKKKGGAELLGVKSNLVDLVWGDDRPARPNKKVSVLDVKFAGKKFEEKIEDLRKELDKKKSAGLIVFFFSYAAVTPTTATLYIDESKLSENVLPHLGDTVRIRPYSAIFEDSKAFGESLEMEAPIAGRPQIPKKKFWISTKASWALSIELGGEEKVEEVRSPIGDAKAIKNATELEGMRACHIRDGASLSEYFAWLEEELVIKGTKLDEVQAADKLEEIRSKKERFVGLSFDTISSTGPNAAVIHYKPERGNCSIIDPTALYLCDSGAQYFDGTTDTTRTLHFGEPKEMERKAYTLVLKGVIALDRAVFPKGTSGFALDTLARQFLWREGLDYRHGTGHGVGSYLNVHEGPIGIGTRIQYAEVPLSIGNVLSDEPGYYEDGKFGIRIENMIMAQEAKTNHKFGDKPWLSFEHVTMVPMCRKLIDGTMLTPEERTWLNEYHQEVYDKTKGFFKEDERTLKWLERETRSINVMEFTLT
ncbi:MAG: hypothetical protein L6R42_000793 [Xanthoria sp. 1 TBL-2021]|nr:MAG: hypothetical protein L6R42_000793 [Xanthoria sp. 1 TBL-2021]